MKRMGLTSYIKKRKQTITPPFHDKCMGKHRPIDELFHPEMINQSAANGPTSVHIRTAGRVHRRVQAVVSLIAHYDNDEQFAR